MILNVFLLVIGFIILIKGADIFVDGASSVAGNFKVSKMLIGLTIVAFGTSAPEFAVSVKSLLSGNGDIVLGNVIGSNILNILLILGVSSLFHSLNVKNNTVKKELPITLLITTLFVVLLSDHLFDNKIPNAFTRSDGFVLLLFFSVFIYYLIAMARNKIEEQSKEKYMSIGKAFVYTIGGIVMIVLGSNFVVDSASFIATSLGVSEKLISLTIIALGTSLPELVTSITATRKGEYDIAIGNVVGSNILNILIILGITAVITNVAIQKSTLLYEIPFMTVITIVLLIFGITGSEVTFIEGVIFWILFLIYLGYLFVMAKKGNDQEEAEAKDNPVWKCMLLMVIGGILVVKGSDFAVSGATEIARYFGMSERFIGLTIVALGTSLPELVTSVTAARRGNTGIAIGNIVGSNIFNILFVIGTTALICTVPFESKFIIDTVIAVLCGAILWIGTFRHKELRKPCGVVMLLCYVAYFLYLCLV